MLCGSGNSYSTMCKYVIVAGDFKLKLIDFEKCEELNIYVHIKE